MAHRPDKSPFFEERSSSGSTSVVLMLMIVLVLAGAYVLATNAVQDDTRTTAQSEASHG